MKVAFYPRTVLDWRNPFWRMLRSALSKNGVQVVAIKFSLLSLIINRPFVGNIHFHYVQHDMPKRPPCFPERAWNLFFSISSNFQNITFRLRLRLAKFLGYRIIYTAHNLVPHEKETRIMKLNIEEIYKLADRVVVMGEKDREALSRFIQNDKIALIPHFSFEGFYPNSITKPEARKRLGISSDKFVLLCFGSIRPYKGIENLLRIFKDSGSQDVLIIAGEGYQDPAYLANIGSIAEGADNIIIKIEPISDDDVQIYMNASDISIFPFNTISNSGAFMLAKSFYKPTIFIDKGNLREYMNESTDMPINDVSDLERAINSARSRKFPSEKDKYLSGITSVDEAAKAHCFLYK